MPVAPFYYDQHTLDLNLPPAYYVQKIQEYGFSKIDVHEPTGDVATELRHFKTLPGESQRILEMLLEGKPEAARKRVLVVLQYLFMSALFAA